MIEIIIDERAKSITNKDDATQINDSLEMDLGEVFCELNSRMDRLITVLENL